MFRSYFKDRPDRPSRERRLCMRLLEERIRQDGKVKAGNVLKVTITQVTGNKND